MASEVKTVRTNDLEIAYEEHGSEQDEPIILLHGFPYDPRCYDEVAVHLATTGYRAIVPYLRGYGPTRFLSAQTLRSGQQSALAQDLLDLLDGLSIEQATLVGYDWGGRAACIVAALYPERVRALVSIEGYNLQNIPQSGTPQEPEEELRLWYQYYFQTERGRRGLEQYRADFCRQLWHLWSPTWNFSEQTYQATAASFNNPDFVEVVIHSYRHRYGAAPGDPRLEDMERRLAEQPPIEVPALVLYGGDDGIDPPPTTSSEDEDKTHFTRLADYKVIEGAGHNLPQEKPQILADLILEQLTQS